MLGTNLFMRDTYIIKYHVFIEWPFTVSDTFTSEEIVPGTKNLPCARLPRLLPLLSASFDPRIESHSGNSHLLIKRFENIKLFLNDQAYFFYNGFKQIAL